MLRFVLMWLISKERAERSKTKFWADTIRLSAIFLEKVVGTFGFYENKYYFCTRNREGKPESPKELGYGVMVTLQILVLSFLVRVRVPQHNLAATSQKICSGFLFMFVNLHLPVLFGLAYFVVAFFKTVF